LGLAGCAPPTSLLRWTSITSGRSFLREVELVGGCCKKEPVFCRSFERGGAESSSLSMDISLVESSVPDSMESLETLLGFFDFRLGEGFAHSGTGYSRSNCCRNRLVYSLPLTRSSASVSRSLRSRGFDASETRMRSSSLSTHAGAQFS